MTKHEAVIGEKVYIGFWTVNTLDVEIFEGAICEGGQRLGPCVGDAPIDWAKVRVAESGEEIIQPITRIHRTREEALDMLHKDADNCLTKAEKRHTECVSRSIRNIQNSQKSIVMYGKRLHKADQLQEGRYKVINKLRSLDAKG